MVPVKVADVETGYPMVWNVVKGSACVVIPKKVVLLPTDSIDQTSYAVTVQVSNSETWATAVVNVKVFVTVVEPEAISK